MPNRSTAAWRMTAPVIEKSRVGRHQFRDGTEVHLFDISRRRPPDARDASPGRRVPATFDGEIERVTENRRVPVSATSIRGRQLPGEPVVHEGQRDPPRDPSVEADQKLERTLRGVRVANPRATNGPGAGIRQ